MSAPDVREAFEAWWDGPLGPYVDDAPREWPAEKRRSWCAWQAALAAPVSPPAPMGEAVDRSDRARYTATCDPLTWRVLDAVRVIGDADDVGVAAKCEITPARASAILRYLAQLGVVAIVPQHKEPAP